MRLRAVACALCTVLLAADRPPEPERVVAARARPGPRLTRVLAAAGVPRPGALLLRVFKEERLLEVWAAAAAEEPFVHLGDHPVCASSGGPGPKARVGDGQVPEGLYRVTGVNPWSRYHLSLRLDYPNAADRARNPAVPLRALGGEIFIHGSCVTIGCIPIGDEAIEEVYLAALDVRARGGEVSVLVLPARPGAPGWAALTPNAAPGHRRLWSSLASISERLDASHRMPKVRAGSEGTYLVE
ncbi:MAG TPA: L,D-transpeptidase family protein [Myxococcaceae bacterium]|nr:L,D-transpeptidase family protein [Myxococcaceae bacterium]